MCWVRMSRRQACLSKFVGWAIRLRSANKNTEYLSMKMCKSSDPKLRVHVKVKVILNKTTTWTILLLKYYPWPSYSDALGKATQSFPECGRGRPTNVCGYVYSCSIFYSPMHITQLQLFSLFRKFIMNPQFSMSVWMVIYTIEKPQHVVVGATTEIYDTVRALAKQCNCKWWGIGVK